MKHILKQKMHKIHIDMERHTYWHMQKFLREKRSGTVINKQKILLTNIFHKRRSNILSFSGKTLKMVMHSKVISLEFIFI